MKTKDWLVFWTVGLIWGTSFLWIKVAVADVTPLVLVGFRTIFGTLGLGTIILINREKMPSLRDLRGTLWNFIFLGFFNIALPWVLFSWGEQFIDSGIASIINSSMPLFTIIIAPLMISEERITPTKAIGLIAGFIGVVFLILPGIQGGWGENLMGQAASLLATISYAFSIVYIRKKCAGLPPELQSFAQLLFGAIIIWIFIFTIEGKPALPELPITWVALLWLGILGSCVSFVLYYGLLEKIGPTRVSLVTYIMPLMSVVLGIVFLGEPFYWQAVVGGLLILAGIYIGNTSIKNKSKAKIVRA